MPWLGQRHTSLTHWKQFIWQQWRRDCLVHRWLLTSIFPWFCATLLGITFRLDDDVIFLKNSTSSIFWAFGSILHLLFRSSLSSAQPQILWFITIQRTGLDFTQWWGLALLPLDCFLHKIFRTFPSFCQLQILPEHTRRCKSSPLLHLNNSALNGVGRGFYVERPVSMTAVLYYQLFLK